MSKQAASSDLSEPIRYAVTVPLPADRAFTLFTEGYNTWWPGHHIGKAEMAEAVLEPRVGGRYYERGVDGSECAWGTVLACDPPEPHRRSLADHRGRRRLGIRPGHHPRQRVRGHVPAAARRPDPGRARAPAHRPARDRGRRDPCGCRRAGRLAGDHGGLREGRRGGLSRGLRGSASTPGAGIWAIMVWTAHPRKRQQHGSCDPDR
jgi:hypothetical protein